MLLVDIAARLVSLFLLAICIVCSSWILMLLYLVILSVVVLDLSSAESVHVEYSSMIGFSLASFIPFMMTWLIFYMCRFVIASIFQRMLLGYSCTC